LKECNITHRRIGRKVAFKKDIDLETKRKEFCLKYRSDIYNDAVFIDEFSFNISDQKRYGYNFKGHSIPEIKYTFKHKFNTKRISVLMAIDRSGIIQYELITGSVNANIFINFLESIKDIVGERPIFLDNASIHRSNLVLQKIKELNLNYNMLPPYSPDLNPIELFFNSTKKVYRNNIKEFLLYSDINQEINHSIEIDDLIDSSINTVDITEHFLKYYNHTIKIMDDIRNNNNNLEIFRLVNNITFKYSV
jgi:transposase